MRLLVTGGTGFIGSHTVVELVNDGHEVIIIDNLSNSKKEVINRIKTITDKDVIFYKCDLLDEEKLESVFRKHQLDAVLHFAGLKSVSESLSKPLLYYSNNIGGSLILCRLMQKYSVRKLVFSSSATVYGSPEKLPLSENSRVGVGITNPYGWSKFMIEKILSDLARADKSFHVSCLRYFNPIGAHASGLIGESPIGTPNNLMPYISRVAAGKLKEINVYGSDYPTPDGTGIRDYIHVVDLAKGHLAALNHSDKNHSFCVYNLGTGSGTSVLKAIHTFEKIIDRPLKYKFADRRAGDVAVCFADVTKAKLELGWQTLFSFEKACEDTWRWQQMNPDGI